MKNTKLFFLLILILCVTNGCGKRKNEQKFVTKEARIEQMKVLEKSFSVDTSVVMNKRTKFLERIEGFIARGDDLNQFIKDKPLLSWAVQNDDVEAVRLLLESGVKVNQMDRGYGLLPIFYAIKSYVVVGDLVEPTADSSEEERKKYQLLSKRKNSIEKSKVIFNLLIAYGVDVNTKSSASETPLHMAVRKGRKDLVVKLITHGADIHAWADRYNVSPIMYAGLYGNWDILEVLIQAGARVNDQAKNGKTALSLAQLRQHELKSSEEQSYFPFIDYDKTIQILKNNGAQ